MSEERTSRATRRESRICLIGAMAKNRVIGQNNRIPWRLPADMAFFKNTTMGHTVVMGRKTFESIGKPLNGRKNVIVTRTRGFAAHGCEVAHSVEEALAKCEGETLFVIGGAEIYEQFMPYADTIYLTVIEQEMEGDAYFPEIDERKWREAARTPGVTDEKNPYVYSFVTYERKDASRNGPVHSD